MKNLDQLYAEHIELEQREREAFNALVDGVAKEADAYGVEYDYVSLRCGGSYLLDVMNKVKDEYEKHLCKVCEQSKPDATDDGDGICAECFEERQREYEAYTRID